MSDDLEFVLGLGEEALSLLRPVVESLQSLDRFDSLLLEHGWLPPEWDDHLDLLSAAFLQMVDLDAIQSGIDDIGAGQGLKAIGALLETIGTVLANLRTPGQPDVIAQLPPPLDSGEFWQEFLRDLGDTLFVRWLHRRLPPAFALLHVAGIVDVRLFVPANDARIPYRRSRVDWASLSKLVSDPGKLMRDAYYQPDGAFDAPLLLDRVANALVALGVQAAERDASQALVRRYWEGLVPPGELRSVEVPVVREGLPGGAASVIVSLQIVPLAEKGSPAGNAPWVGAAVVPFLSGTVNATIPVAGPFLLTLGGGIDGLSGPALELRNGEPVEVTTTAEPPVADLTATLLAQPEIPFLLLGTRNSHRIEISKLAVSAQIRDIAGARPEILLSAGGAARLTIQLASGDGFLNRILGTDPQKLDIDTTVSWSSLTGHLSFDAAGGLRLVLPINKNLGPVELRSLAIEIFGSTEGAIRFGAGITARAEIGPITAKVEEVGIALTLRPEDQRPTVGGLSMQWGFLPPKGIGLSVDAGPVSGGGFLSFDPERGQYAGGIQLSIKALHFSAIGLLSTRMPDGSPGFSLLIVLTAEFPPIQLGFGFTLSGLGGLLGINRTAVVEALRDGVRQRSLDAILFPKDIVKNADRYVADLGRIFPVAEGRYVFGPMVRLGWGLGNIISLEAALVLELPSPVRLALLGRLRAALPQPEGAVADLRLDAVGIIDFGVGEASVDASLTDSRIATFALSGDMAVRLGWGQEKHFALSTGGFNPAFTPPPNFPGLSRMALSLSESENPLLRLEAYFAVTSNTVQFGARAEVSASADTFLGRFSALAYIYFDALVQLSPFQFAVDLGGGVEVARNGRPILRAELAASLDGPSPFHAAGHVEVDFLGKHRIQFEATSGDGAPSPPPEIDLDALLLDVVSHPDVWTALPPDGASGPVSLTDTTRSGDILVHPLGGITLQQRLLPFGKVITRFGSAVPSRGPVTYQLATLGAGNVPPSPVGATVLGDFAPGQYDDIDGLSAPAFEAMPAGGSLRLPNWQLPDGPAVVATPGYDEAVIDSPPAPAQPFPLDLLGRFAAAGAARRTGGFSGAEGRSVRVTGERFVVADANTLLASVDEKTSPTSSAEARDRKAGSRRQVVVGAHEAMVAP